MSNQESIKAMADSLNENEAAFVLRIMERILNSKEGENE